MQFEEFDKKVKEAADRHHPAYDQQAWDKMENLLDKHLPVKEDKRRRFLLLLLFTLLLGGTALLITKPWKSGNRNDSGIASSNSQTATPVNNNSNAPQPVNNSNTVNTNNTSTSQPVPSIQTKDGKEAGNSPVTANNLASPQQSQEIGNTVPGNNKVSNKSSFRKTAQPERDNNAGVAISSGTAKTSHKKNLPVSDKNNKVSSAQPELVATNDNSNNPKQTGGHSPVSNSQPVTSDNKTTTTSETAAQNVVGATMPASGKSTEQPKEETKKTDLVKVKSKRKSYFFLAASMGPDVSFTGSDKLGKMKLPGGIGLGYSYKDRVTLRTGFYQARKIYTASPSAYNPPAVFYNYYPYLEKVEADCKVYEIPLLVSYKFGNKPGKGFFATTGLSSYLMKKETYNYFYKASPTGPTYSRKFTLLDANKHFFSVVTLSAGYQLPLGKRFSISAEPYAKIPLKGVGYGKVKLNSGGVLFSVGFRPFH